MYIEFLVFLLYRFPIVNTVVPGGLVNGVVRLVNPKLPGAVGFAVRGVGRNDNEVIFAPNAEFADVEGFDEGFTGHNTVDSFREGLLSLGEGVLGVGENGNAFVDVSVHVVNDSGGGVGGLVRAFGGLGCGGRRLGNGGVRVEESEDDRLEVGRGKDVVRQYEREVRSGLNVTPGGGVPNE